MMLRGYIKERRATPHKCAICGNEIKSNFATFIRTKDNVGMCFNCYIAECRNVRKDRRNCACLKCKYRMSEACDKRLILEENQKLEERIRRLKRTVGCYSKTTAKKERESVVSKIKELQSEMERTRNLISILLNDYEKLLDCLSEL